MKITTSQERIAELFDSDPRNDTTIARELGVSKQAVSAWRNGIRSPKKPVLVKIAEKYNVSIEWLMGFDVDRNIVRTVPEPDIYTKLIMNMSPEDYYTVLKIFEKTEINMRKEGKL